VTSANYGREGQISEGPAGVHGVCATANDAEALAERLVRHNGGGEILIYDEQLRLRAVKRLPGISSPDDLG
jgi:hypothetical protein